jgi:hypothetical protein
MRWALVFLSALLAAGSLTAFVGPPTDQKGLADMIPADAPVSIGVRDIPGLMDRYDRFRAALGKPGGRRDLQGIATIADVGFQLNVSDAPRFLLTSFEKPSLPPWGIAGVPSGRGGGLKPGKVIDVGVGGHLLWNGHRYHSESEKTLRRLANSKPLVSIIRPAQRAAMSEADLLLHFNIRAWEPFDLPDWKWVRASMRPADAAEERAADQVMAALRSTQHFLLTATLDDTVRVRMMYFFGKKLQPGAAELIRSVQGRPPGLSGLPDGRALAAHAAGTDGAQDAVAGKMFLQMMLREDLAGRLLSKAEQPLIAGVFSTLWRKVRGRQIALYHNTDEEKHGLLSLVGIFDTDDPKRLMNEIADLARFAKGKDLDLDGAKGADVAAVKRLIRDLDDDEYDVRESASAKLALIGEPALPFVEQAAKATDPEVRKRATRLLTEIRALRDLRRKELLADDTPRLIRPGFLLQRGAEKIDALTVDVVHVKLEKRDASAAALMRKLGGPDWAIVRMAMVGKKVVVLVGSDVGLFRQALKNVKSGAPGLEASKSLAAFRKQADRSRIFELHVALESLEAFSTDGIDADKVKAGPLSSLTVSVDATRFEAAAWLTPTGFKALAKRLGWWVWL